MGKLTVVRVTDQPSAGMFSRSRRLPTEVPWIPMPPKSMIICPIQLVHCGPLRDVAEHMPCDKAIVVPSRLHGIKVVLVSVIDMNSARYFGSIAPIWLGL